MSKFKKILSRLLCLIVVLATFFACGTTALASSTGEGDGKIWAFYDGSFSKSWELYHSGDSGEANLTYGFNTFLIHEDYAWANHSTKAHYAEIDTDGGRSAQGPSKEPGKVSRIEITHLTVENFYFCLF